MFKNPNHVYGPLDLKVPIKLNFGDFMLQQLFKYNNNVAIVNAATDEAWTYSQMAQHAMNLAVSLTRLGVRKGHTVGMCVENRQEFWSTIIGIACTGATVTFINIGYNKGEIKHVLNISKPKYMFLSPTTYKTQKKNIDACNCVKTFILYGNEEHHNTLLYNDLAIVNSNSDLKNHAIKNDVSYDEFEVRDVLGQMDTLFILYSSGTTGLPKGVMLTHLNVIASCAQYRPLNPGETQMVTLLVNPLYHSMGLMGTIAPISVGKKIVYMAKFDIDLYLRTIEKYKIAQLTAVPPMLIALCKAPAHYDVSSVQLIYSGAAPLRDDTIAAVRKRFPNARAVLQGYGMTETTLAAMKDTIDSIDNAVSGSVGTVTGGTIVKVADQKTGEALPCNKPGEICIKGPIVMKGYIGKDRSEDFDEEGFFKTGDIGYYDEQKRFFIVDRKKELIKYKGFQVPPAEIEALLLQLDSIRDAGVVGVEHRTAGEVPMAFVVLQPGKTISEKDIMDFVAENLSNPKRLRGGVRFVDQIPRNPSGKILRRVLRDMVKKTKSKL